MSIQDYIGRTVDVVAYAGVVPGQSALLSQTLIPAGTGEICTGIQKLVQRFLLIVLTEQGSMPFAPTEGTDFMTKARQGYLRTPLDVFAAFSSALVDVKTTLQALQLSTDPLDEQYASASIEAVVITLDSIALTVQISSQAGTSVNFIMPVTITPGG